MLDSSCCGRVVVLEMFLGRDERVLARTVSLFVSGQVERMSVRELMTEESLLVRFLISLARLIWLLFALFALTYLRMEQ
jgi:tRNA(Phe) wybutosine-synthesizing methylase Tyw3